VNSRRHARGDRKSPKRRDRRLGQTAGNTKRYVAEGVEAGFVTPRALQKSIPVEIAKWAKAAKDAGMKTE